MSKTSILGWLKVVSLVLTIIIGLMSGQVVEAAALGSLVQAVLSAVGLNAAKDDKSTVVTRPTAGG